MTEGDSSFWAVWETTVFLSHFEDLPEYRQKGKVAYPLDEVLLLMLAAALAGRRRWQTSRASAGPSWRSCGAFDPSPTARPRTTSWASSSPSSTRSRSRECVGQAGHDRRRRHGRIETRTITVFHDVGWLQDNHPRPGTEAEAPPRLASWRAATTTSAMRRSTAGRASTASSPRRNLEGGRRQSALGRGVSQARTTEGMKESKIEEGHLMPDHVHMLLSIPPKLRCHRSSSTSRGKSAILLTRVMERANATSWGSIFGPGVLREHGRPGRERHPRLHPQPREEGSEARAIEPLALTTPPLGGSKLNGPRQRLSYR